MRINSPNIYVYGVQVCSSLFLLLIQIKLITITKRLNIDSFEKGLSVQLSLQPVVRPANLLQKQGNANFINRGERLFTEVWSVSPADDLWEWPQPPRSLCRVRCLPRFGLYGP